MPTLLDFQQVIRQVYDESINRLRVDSTATITPPPGGLPVLITHTEDSIRIGDGVDLVTLTTVGAKKALDVYVNNSLTVDVDHTTDSIRLGDGVNFLTSSNLGSKYGLDVFDLNKAVTPTVANVNIVTASTEYSYTFPSNVKKFQVRARGTSKLQCSYISGQSGTTYVTIAPGNAKTIEDTNFSGTLYFQGNKNNEVLEIEYWI